MTLHLIRHAKAGKRGSDYPDDSQRPLTREGRAQARELAKLFKVLRIRFDYLFSSPHTRALETARALEARLKKGRLETLQSLTSDLYPQLLVDIATKSGDNGLKNGVKEFKTLKKAENVTGANLIIALVGHEPYLGEFASYLLTADTKRVQVDFKKAGRSHPEWLSRARWDGASGAARALPCTFWGSKKLSLILESRNA